jgi:ribose 5-phosphate isomerase A
MQDEHIEQLIAKYINDEDVVAIGSSPLGEKFLKKLAIALESNHIKINNVDFIPTSMRMATIASSLGLKIVDINEREVDVAIDFADQVDKNFNFVKRNTASFVRDKMIAQSAANLIVIALDKSFVEKVKGTIPFEVVTFGWKRTMNQLDSYGKASRREKNGVPIKTETGNYVIDVKMDNIWNYNELEYESKNIPGVIETGLFVGYADKVLLHGKKIEMLSSSKS